MAAAAHIDDELYSRQVRFLLREGVRLVFSLSTVLLPSTLLTPLQLFVMGHAAQARMQESDVLIVGLTGVGVEIGEEAGLFRGMGIPFNLLIPRSQEHHPHGRQERDPVRPDADIFC